jgi:hypothetical protein
MARIVRLVVLVLALLAAACDIGQPAFDPSLTIPGFTDQGPLHPSNPAADCATLSRCADMLAEIGRWSERTAPELGPPTSVTFHGARDEVGNVILMTRSGGSTWIAVVTWSSGRRAAVVVGCGVGVDRERCFSQG